MKSNSCLPTHFCPCFVSPFSLTYILQLLLLKMSYQVYVSLIKFILNNLRLYRRCYFCCLFGHHIQVYPSLAYLQLKLQMYSLHHYRYKYISFVFSIQCSLWSSAIVLLVIVMIILDLMVSFILLLQILFHLSFAILFNSLVTESNKRPL